MELLPVGEFDFTTLLPFAVFGAVAAVIWLVADLFFSKRDRAEERLERMKGGRMNELESSKDGFAKMLEKASPALAKPLQPKSEEEVGKLREKLNFAGYRADEAMSVFLGLKFVAAGIGLFLGGGVALFLYGINTRDRSRVATYLHENGYRQLYEFNSNEWVNDN